MVEAIGLGRRFGSLRALRDLDLRIQPGGALAVFGPNGAGKTTLMRLLSTAIRQTEGTLRLFGQPEASGEVRKRIGLLSHGTFLYGDLTGVENLRFFGALFQVQRIDAQIAEGLARVGLTEWQDRPVRTYSQGMKQRLALARAFLHDPDLLLLDEPYSGLDPHAVRHLQTILAAVHRRGKTIVLTTHDLEHGLEICDQAAILAGGRLVWHSDRFVPGPREMAQIYERQVRKPVAE